MSKFDILKYYEIALRHVENIIGVNSTSNFRIDKICMRIIPNYLGTFSSNNVPRMKNDTCCIVNTDSNKNLKHIGHVYSSIRVKYIFMIVLHVIIGYYHHIGNI